METHSIEIGVPAEVVFEAIRSQRNTRRRQLQSYDGKVAVVKETFEGLPVLGSVECVWEETEEPYTAISFRMLSSSNFKSSEGAYVLTESADGTSTTLELKAHLDIGITAPFAEQFSKAATHRDSTMRLDQIKKAAEELFQTRPPVAAR